MQERRNFTPEFKRQVVEELLSGVSRPAQLCRRHNIAVSLLYHWKKQYGLGKLNNEPVKEAAMRDKIEKLERMPEGYIIPTKVCSMHHMNTSMNSSAMVSRSACPGKAIPTTMP